MSLSASLKNSKFRPQYVLRFVEDEQGQTSLQMVENQEPQDLEKPTTQIYLMGDGFLETKKAELLSLLELHQHDIPNFHEIVFVEHTSPFPEFWEGLEQYLQKNKEDLIYLITRPQIEDLSEIYLKRDLEAKFFKNTKNFHQHYTPKTKGKAFSAKQRRR